MSKVKANDQQQKNSNGTHSHVGAHPSFKNTVCRVAPCKDAAAPVDSSTGNPAAIPVANGAWVDPLVNDGQLMDRNSQMIWPKMVNTDY